MPERDDTTARADHPTTWEPSPLEESVRPMTAENRGTERVKSPERRPLEGIGARSLIFKVLFRTLPLLLAAALLLMLLAWHFTRRDLLAEIDTDVDVFATVTCRVLDGLLWNYQTEEMVSALASISSHSAMLGAEIYDEDGKLFLSYGLTPADHVDGILTVWRDIYRRQPDGSRTDMGRLAIHYTHAFAEERLKLDLLRHMYLITLIILFTLGCGGLCLQQNREPTTQSPAGLHPHHGRDRPSDRSRVAKRRRDRRGHPGSQRHARTPGRQRRGPGGQRATVPPAL
jgi:hypothetical protein